MNLGSLLEACANSKRISALTKLINAHTNAKVHLKGVLCSAESLIVKSLYDKTKGFHLIIAKDKESAEYFQSDLKIFFANKDIYLLPDSFKQNSDRKVLDKNSVLLRTETLNAFLTKQNQGEVVVTYPEALLEKVAKPKYFTEHNILIEVSQKVDVDQLTEILIENHFERVDFVFEPGQFSIRGDIVDLFSYGNNSPYRIELFDKEVESIRTFDTISQLSDKKINRLSIMPNAESLTNKDEKISLFEFLPQGSIIWHNNIEPIFETLSNLSKANKAECESVELVLASNIKEAFSQRKTIQLGGGSCFAEAKQIVFDIVPQASFNKNFDLLISDLQQKSKLGYDNYFFADNAKQIERFHHIFEDKEARLEYIALPLSISHGFVDNDLKTTCYTDHQIFDRHYKHGTKKSFSSKEALLLKTLKELQPGDFVTHIDHGIGKYSGLEKININGNVQESIRLVYANNDLLYVPITALHKISKYSGKEGSAPRVNKIGSDVWQKLKRTTKKKIKDIARDLIKLYAARKSAEGFAFSPDTYLQDELASSFIYDETPDQTKAIQAVTKDMEAGMPMDRLVCGDVGFGKTEVAIRAAFKAVADSKQVAVLVPTTILALQHYKSFMKRLGGLPCTVDYINRFKTTKQRNETLKAVEEGKVDILIGTHAILNKAIKYKDLGLLIIDEEQKFGVKAKEKLREIKVNVDTLTLTATPIPRTLQFSLMSARDLSIINTPPPNRQPISTELQLWSDEKIQESIYFEVNRGGQVFFIHNRVQNIADISAMIQRLCPDLKVCFAHGQMDGDKIENVMQAFMNGEFDVMVSTSIVESGLDIPNVNTIIINNAHQFGLSDIHQLRGRVGRSNRKAFCFLLAPTLTNLTADAKKRLQTIVDFSDLGSGFNIAMRDLDIRGAGNLLGGEQSGFISEIGFDMYQKILDEAMMELKETEFKNLFKNEDLEHSYVRDVHLDTDITIMLPDSYVNNITERLSLYNELGELETEEELLRFKKNVEDRFGPMPQQGLELMNAVRLQWKAKRLGFERVILKNKSLKCVFPREVESRYFESSVFTSMLQFIQSRPLKYNLKQTPKQLLLSIADAKNIQHANQALAEIENAISKSVFV